MVAAGIYLKFAKHRPSEWSFGKHPAHGTLQKSLRMFRRGARLLPSVRSNRPDNRNGDNTLCRVPAAAHANFFGIDNNDKIAGIQMRRKTRFVFAAQTMRHKRSQPPQNRAIGIIQQPVAPNVAAFDGGSIMNGSRVAHKQFRYYSRYRRILQLFYRF